MGGSNTTGYRAGSIVQRHADPTHDPMRVFAADHGLNFLSVPGDHNAALMETASRVTPLWSAVGQPTGANVITL